MEIELNLLPEGERKAPDFKNLVFGKIFTPHMFIMEYTNGKGWHSPRIVPFSKIELHPAAIVLHYSQTIFEGMKAYYGVDGKIRIFRPKDHYKRLCRSADRMCIPKVDEKIFIEAIKKLVWIDRDWIPREKGAALYIRPFIFATEGSLGVHPSHEYYFMIILSPVGPYYKEGFNPIKIYVEEHFVRAFPGGTGDIKAGGNYGASIKAQELAKEKGFTQILWLDGKERKYVEEVGTMNIFFVFDNELTTPALTGSILPGITRDSVLKIAKDKGIKASERRISIDEVIEGIQTGRLKESFGTGTAVVISPVGEIFYKEKGYIINNREVGPLAKLFFEEITGIQYGEKEDPYGWTEIVENEI